MNILFSPDASWVQPLSRTLVHFLWQGAAIGLAAFLLLKTVRLTSAARYAVGIGALALMLAAPLATFAILQHETAPVPQILRVPGDQRSMQTTAGMGAASAANGAPESRHTGTSPLPRPVTIPYSLIAVFWLAGVVALSVRLLGGWLVARRLLSRAVRPAAPDIHALAHRVAARLPLTRLVRILESARVAAPVTIGWLKPVVLLPAAALSGLTPNQVEALLAHELAHVRRHDYFVNLLQSAVETLLFYHPSVWWASRLVRTEREHCCDDVAVRVCDRLVYATALADLAASAATPRMVLAASGGSLLRRVHRILGNTSGTAHGGAGWIPAFVIMILAGMIAPSAFTPAVSAVQLSRPPETQPGIVGGTMGGSQSGVVGGVEGGTSAGITGGVVGGVPSGKAGGIAGEAVSAGVGGKVGRRTTGATVAGGTRGIQAQNTGAAGQASSSPPDTARLTELLQQKQHQLQQLLEQLKELESRQQEIKNAGNEMRQRAEIERLRTELQFARDRYERTKRLVEVGTARPQMLSEIGAELTMLEQKLAAAQMGGHLMEEREQLAELTAQLQLSQQQLERTKQLFAKGMAGESTLKEAEEKAATFRQQLSFMQKQLELKETEVELQRRQADRKDEIAKIEQALREIGATLQAEQRSISGARQGIGGVSASGRDQQLLASSTPIDAPDATVRAGDLLVVEIAGEPDLPRVYVVAASGSIRLPLVGEVPVAGLTSAQVQEKLVQELTNRKLAAAPQITVKLRRPSGSGSGSDHENSNMVNS